MKNLLRYLLLVLLMATLAGCGSRSDTTDTTTTTGTTGTGTGTTTTTPTPTTTLKVTLIADSTQLPSGKSGKVVLSATVKNSDNQLLEGEVVTFSASSGDLAVIQSTTDAAGLALAELTAGVDASNRDITVTVTAGGVSDTITVQVIGTTLSIDGPTSIISGSSADLSLTLLDANGDPVAGEVVTVVSAQGNPLTTPATTNNSGQTLVAVTGNSSTADAISASALGGSVIATFNLGINPDSFVFLNPASAGEIPIDPQSQTVSVEWKQADAVTGVIGPVANADIQFTTTRGRFSNGLSSAVATTNASGIATEVISSPNAGIVKISATATNGPSAERVAEFIATNPASLTLQASPSTLASGETSNLTAIARDAQGNFVKNQNVTFNIVQDVSGGALSGGSAFTNSAGQAGVVYTAGGGGPNTATISAEVTNDAGVKISDSIDLSIGNKALRIVLGTGGVSFAANDVQNQKPYVVQVTTSQGVPVPGVRVELSVQPLGYYKGWFAAVDTNVPPDGINDEWQIMASYYCAAEDQNRNGVLDRGLTSNCNGVLDAGEDANNNSLLDSPEDLNSNGVIDTEDANGNGVLDPSEDLNNNGLLDAGEDANGNGLLDLSEDLNGNGILDTEDVNGNGILDVLEDYQDGEDRNCSGALEPSNSATIGEHPTLLQPLTAGALTTDATGFGYFSVIYPKSHSHWVEVELKARALVAGSESIEKVSFTLPGIASDYSDATVAPPGQLSPYGTILNCSFIN